MEELKTENAGLIPTFGRLKNSEQRRNNQKIMKLSKVMKLRMACCALVGAGSLLACPNLFAAYTVIGTGSLTITAPGLPDQAGPYTVTGVHITSGPGPNHGTASPFETFCLGTQIDYTSGSTYNYEISTTVQPTGLSTGSPPGVGSPGYVTWGAAYLYSQFSANPNGSLSGTWGTINFGGTGNNALNDALQAAIWALQGQNYLTLGLTFSGGGSAPVAGDVNYYLDAAAAAATAAGLGSSTTGTYTSGDELDDNGRFEVYALNMYDASTGAYVQPQLCIIPEPTTIFAGAFLLLPFGINTARFLRKSRPA
jgi:hypothetical protein